MAIFVCNEETKETADYAGSTVHKSKKAYDRKRLKRLLGLENR